MRLDEEAKLHAQALGVLRSLRAAAVGTHCRESLTRAWDVLLTVRPQVPRPAPADVGAQRRTSDFRKLQKLLLDLSMSAGVNRKDVILTMMFVTKAEAEWVGDQPRSRSALARLRRRRSDQSRAPLSERT